MSCAKLPISTLLKNDEAPFQVGPLDFFQRLKAKWYLLLVVMVAEKSTFAQLLTGLYRPHSGQILLNGKRVEEASVTDYRQQFSAVFSDFFYLFPHLVDGQGTDADDSLVSEWMQRLEMSNKVSVENGRLSDTRYSQGQRKRLAFIDGYSGKKGMFVVG
ncbi:ATP-binding cassette domain-containing protein [Vibrio sinaloensis]|nr:ATP-binding cassette domain-containing protein [Vibrio sinaloensis]